MRELPPRMHQKGRRYYYVKRNTLGKLIWAPLSRDLSEALHQYALLEAGKPAAALEEGDAPQHWLSGIARTIHAQALKRARDSNIEFTLTVDDIAGMGVSTNWRCSLTGIRFAREQVGPGDLRPWMPSIDRVHSGRGYTRENCRLVCVAANFAMNAWGQEVLHQLAVAYVKHHRMAKPLEASNARPSRPVA